MQSAVSAPSCAPHRTTGTTGQEDRTISSRNDTIAEFLDEAGIDRAVTGDAFVLDAALQQLRRRFLKRELGTAALAALGLEQELDLPELEVLIAIWAPSNEFGTCDETETMVATVAARLHIDPSRASRLVSVVIGKGLAQRAASQEDARRTVLELTPRGQAIIEAVRRFKFLVMGDFLSGWTEEERRTFVPLLERFVAWTDDAGRVGPDRFETEVAEIAAQLRRKCAP